MITAVTLGTTNLGSSSELGVDLLFGVACAAWGYFISRRHRMVRGVTPWRLPSVVWAMICLVLQPFGIIMELVAEYTTRPTLSGQAPPVAPQQYPHYTTSRAPQVIEPSPQDAVEVPVDPRFAPPDDGSGKLALFGWYHDPKGRHELRYWDGRCWSDHVSDAGELSLDTFA